MEKLNFIMEQVRKEGPETRKELSFFVKNLLFDCSDEHLRFILAQELIQFFAILMNENEL